jgi:hypothetical protein
MIFLQLNLLLTVWPFCFTLLHFHLPSFQSPNLSIRFNRWKRQNAPNCQGPIEENLSWVLFRIYWLRAIWILQGLYADILWLIFYSGWGLENSDKDDWRLWQIHTVNGKGAFTSFTLNDGWSSCIFQMIPIGTSCFSGSGNLRGRNARTKNKMQMIQVKHTNLMNSDHRITEESFTLFHGCH